MNNSRLVQLVENFGRPKVVVLGDLILDRYVWGDAERISQALRANAAIAFPEGDQQFGTIDAAGKDEVLIAEVRPDPSIRGGFWVWAVCDNLRRSSALNAVLLAEKVMFGSGAAN